MNHIVAAIAKSGLEIGNHCRAIVPASRMGPPTEGRCRYDAASDSNFRRRKVEQFRLQRHRAGKQNGPPTAVVAATLLRPILIFFAAK